MIYIKIKQSLHSIVLVCCVLHTFGRPIISGVTFDSPERLGLGVGLRLLDLDLDRSQNLPKALDIDKAWSHPEVLSNDQKKSLSKQTRQSASLEVDLADADSVQNISSELSDLFSVRSGNASVDSGSQPPVSRPRPTFVGESFVKIQERKSNVSNIVTLTSSDSSPRTSSTTLRPNPSQLLVVPSEGGLMQDLSSVSYMEARNNLLNAESAASNGPVGLQTKDSETTRPSTVVDLDRKSQDSHISARKGASSSDKTEPTSNKLNGTTEQFSFTGTSSELPYINEVHTQKITGRKGAEPPKIFPRKGVTDQSANLNSSDLFVSETNDTSNPTIMVTDRPSPTQPLVSGPRPTTMYISNQGDIVKDIITNTASSLQNSTRPRTDVTQKPSTPSISSESSAVVEPITLVASTSKSDTVSGTSVKKSNVSSNITAPLIGGRNDSLDKSHLEDKSGIIASYPPLRKRLKPLKTTDTNTINSSTSPLEHTSGGHDYVVPIVVTILTIPMLVVLVLFLYKKGSEFWERRHYRRMDFLIDGMYND